MDKDMTPPLPHDEYTKQWEKVHQAAADKKAGKPVVEKKPADEKKHAEKK